MPEKNQGGTKRGFRLLFNLKGGFQNAEKIQGGTKNAFNFQGGLFHCHELFRGASKLNDFVLQHLPKN